MLHKKNVKTGFTLVELLAVIVILAIILVIAVPKIMDVINSSKKSTLETSVKMIASTAEKTKMQNTILGKEDATITCDSVAKLSSSDYESCTIEFDGNTAKVTVKGKGKFEGLSVCEGTKNSATATTEGCSKLASKTIAELVTTDGEVQHYTVDYEGTTYDAGIRYTGSNPNNYVLFNCDDLNDIDTCEKWRIIGVFDVDGEKRVKIINTASTFSASWDSSASDVNYGEGINQWFPSGDYEGADLYQLLNGFYIGESDTCGYNYTSRKSTLSKTCTAESLTSANMKPLTSSAKNLISNATWHTYGVRALDFGGGNIESTNAGKAYLQEKGISKQYTGKECSDEQYCNDTIERTTSGRALIGLMSVSDIGYANGWLNARTVLWSITPYVISSHSYEVWYVNSSSTYGGLAATSVEFCPTTYLKSNVQIKSGSGTEIDPYILKIE